VSIAYRAIQLCNFALLVQQNIEAVILSEFYNHFEVLTIFIFVFE